MKKLLTVTCLAGLLSIPSVVFAAEAEPEDVISDEIMSAEAVPEEVISDEIMSAEAVPVEPELSPEMQGHIGTSHSGPVLYGSIRGGVQSVSGGATSVTNIAGRWGIKGSSEVAEGLNAVYNFEQGFGSATALQNSARLSYIGLSGGFGSLTIGRLNSASNNTVGKITNKSFSRSGGAGISGKLGSAVSYTLDVSGVKLQADVVMDDTTTADIDHVEFGISVPVGDIGKIAFAHVREPGYTTTKLRTYMDVEVSGKTGALALAFTDKVTVAAPGLVGTGTSTIPKIVLPAKTAKDIDDGGKNLPITLPLNSTLLDLVYTTKVKSKNAKGEVITTGTGADKKDVEVNTSVDTDRKVWVKESAHADKKLENYTEYKDEKDATKNGFYHDECYEAKTKKPKSEAKCVKKTQYIYDEKDSNASLTKATLTVVEDIDVDVAQTVTLATGTASVKTNIPPLEVTINGTTVDTELTLTGKATQKSDPFEVLDYSSNHIAAEATLGAVKGYLGYSETDTGGVKSDTTQFGISGALGESGVSYLLEVNKGDVNTLWGIGLYKMLGGGAFAAFEHGGGGGTGTSVAFIGIDF